MSQPLHLDFPAELRAIVVLVPGFLFLLREFRFYALLVGVVYFPTMYWITMWLSFWILVMLGYATF